MTNRAYKCLAKQEFVLDGYKLIPIRDEDKYSILKWRNEQIDILRQKRLLTKEDQDQYFENVVDALFEEDRPDQLLFSFLEKNVLIGYGGLVHIDWESRNAEVSFITDTKRSVDAKQFKGDWSNYLKLLKKVSGSYLGFVKIFTYAYDIRPHLFEMLRENGFAEEARLKAHIRIGNEFQDVLIHSFFLSRMHLSPATEKDAALLLNWANDDMVRKNSFNPEKIATKEHYEWFRKKLIDRNCLILIASVHERSVGQIRFDRTDNGDFEIDFSLDRAYRGQGLGATLIRLGLEWLFQKGIILKRIVGRVKSGNVSSALSFLKAGFVRSENEGENFGADVYVFIK